MNDPHDVIALADGTWSRGRLSSGRLCGRMTWRARRKNLHRGATVAVQRKSGADGGEDEQTDKRSAVTQKPGELGRGPPGLRPALQQEAPA